MNDPYVTIAKELVDCMRVGRLKDLCEQEIVSAGFIGKNNDHMIEDFVMFSQIYEEMRSDIVVYMKTSAAMLN